MKPLLYREVVKKARQKLVSFPTTEKSDQAP